MLFFYLLSSQVNANDILVVTENFPPYQFKEAGHVKGKATKVVTKILDESGLDYKIELINWSEAMFLVENRNDVLIYSLTRSAERESKFKWISKIASPAFYIHGHSDKDYPESVSKMIDAGYYAACPYMDYKCSEFKRLGFPEDKILEVAESNAKPELLIVNIRKADLFIENIFSAPFRLRQIGLDPNDFKPLIKLERIEDFYLAAGNGIKTELLEKIMAAVIRLEADGKPLAYTMEEQMQWLEEFN